MPLQREMTQQAKLRRRIIVQLESLPALPEILNRIIDCANRDDTSIKDLRDLILQDQSITAKVLQLANSAVFHQKKPIKNISDAVVLVGFQAVTDLATSTALHRSFKYIPDSDEFNLQNFWLHTLAAAEAARLCAKQARYQNLERAYLIGLLHDLGKVVQASVYHKDFEDSLFDARAEDRPLHEMEFTHFDCDHGDTGAWLGETWGLPKPILMAMQYHHRPEACPVEFRLEAYLAQAADYFTHRARIGASGNPVPPEFPKAALNKLHIMKRDIVEIASGLRKIKDQLGTTLQIILI